MAIIDKEGLVDSGIGDEWRTPRELFERLHKEFCFTVDAYASSANAQLTRYWTATDDANAQNWEDEVVWMNPPYSRGNINQAMKTAHQWWTNAKVTSVALVRCDPSTTWFQQYVDKTAKEVRMLTDRIRFEGAPHLYNFPCAVVVYSGNRDNGTGYRLWNWRTE